MDVMHIEVESLKAELHAFSKNSKIKREIYHINHVNYIHKIITNYFNAHYGRSSKYLNEYLALIAYRCMHKLQDVQLTLFELSKCKCYARWKDYVRKSWVIF